MALRFGTVPTVTNQSLEILVYSDDAHTRASIIAAIGRRPSADGPLVSTTEVATEPALMAALDASAHEVSRGGAGVSLVILDGEATPAGGMGIARAIKDEIFQAPKILLVIGRPSDAWLASWSRADAVVTHPIDPFGLAGAAARLLGQVEAN
jgi:CheY-like chemotaxis protein